MAEARTVRKKGKMAGVNKAIIVGRLGNDPDLKETSGGTKICRLSVATSRTWLDKQSNEKQEETEWHRVTVWGKQGENCAKYLSKGREVYVEGRLRTSQYQKEGVTCYSTEIVAEAVQFIGGKPDGQSQGKPAGEAGGSAGKSTSSEPDPDDDIPF